MATTTEQDHVELTAQCLCKEHTFTANVPRSSLPLEAHVCHCNSCRHVTGAMNTNVVPWSGDVDAIEKSTLRRYSFSKRIKILFCGTCSSPMLWEILQHDEATGKAKETEYDVFTGVLRNEGPRGLLKIVDHIFVGDTLDGGSSMWTRAPGGDGGAPAARRWHGARGASQQLPDDWPPGPPPPPPAAHWRSEPRDISFGCHCAGVDLIYRRTQADGEFAACQRPEAKLPRFVDPASGKPVVAGMDACDSCRASSGVDFFHWTSSSLRHVGFSSSGGGGGDRERPFPATLADLYAAVSGPRERRDPRLGTLAVYGSSDGVRRYFCSRCSACVFYAAEARHEDNDDHDDDVVNIAMGLFKSPEGARAEGAFLWQFGGPVRHREDVLGGWREAWLESIEAECEAWRVQRNFPEWWRLMGQQLEGTR